MARNPVFRMAPQSNDFFGVDRGVDRSMAGLGWNGAYIDECQSYTVKTIDIDLCATVAGQIALAYCKRVGYIP